MDKINRKFQRLYTLTVGNENKEDFIWTMKAGSLSFEDDSINICLRNLPPLLPPSFFYIFSFIHAAEQILTLKLALISKQDTFAIVP